MCDNLCFGAIAELPIAAAYQPAFDDSAFNRLIESPDEEGVFVLNIRARNTIRPPAIDVPLEPLASYPIAGEYLDDAFSALIADESLWFSDRNYATRPEDTVIPNLAPRASLLQAMDFSQSVPSTPSSGTRSQISTGIAKINNAAGELNEILKTSTIRNREITLRFGPLYEEVRDALGGHIVTRYADLGLGIVLAEYIGSDWGQERGVVSVFTRSVRDVLNFPIHQAFFQGTGAAEGDFELAGVAKPVLFGDCFNVTPRLISRAFLIYQVHLSAVLAIDIVRDSGVILTYVGDYPSYNALALAPLAPGEWASCFAEGLFRLAASAAGKVTADVRGAVFSTGYVAEPGPLLFAVATEYGRVPAGDVEASSIFGLPAGAMGLYYDGSDANLKIADFFDDVLGSLNGWFGLSRASQVRVGLNQNPDTAPINHTVQKYQIQDLRREESTDITRKSQSLMWRKNFTPMTDDDLSPLVVGAERQALKAAGHTVRRASSIAAIIDESAEDFGPIETYISSQVLAESVAQSIVDIEEKPRQRWRLKMPRSAIRWIEGQVIEVFTDQYGFDAGKRFVITGVDGRISQRKLEMEFELRG